MGAGWSGSGEMAMSGPSAKGFVASSRSVISSMVVVMVVYTVLHSSPHRLSRSSNAALVAMPWACAAPTASRNCLPACSTAATGASSSSYTVVNAVHSCLMPSTSSTKPSTCCSPCCRSPSHLSLHARAVAPFAESHAALRDFSAFTDLRSCLNSSLARSHCACSR